MLSWEPKHIPECSQEHVELSALIIGWNTVCALFFFFFLLRPWPSQSLCTPTASDKLEEPKGENQSFSLRRRLFAAHVKPHKLTQYSNPTLDLSLRLQHMVTVEADDETVSGFGINRTQFASGKCLDRKSYKRDPKTSSKTGGRDQSKSFRASLPEGKLWGDVLSLNSTSGQIRRNSAGKKSRLFKQMKQTCRQVFKTGSQIRLQALIMDLILCLEARLPK